MEYKKLQNGDIEMTESKSEEIKIIVNLENIKAERDEIKNNHLPALNARLKVLEDQITEIEKL